MCYEHYTAMDGWGVLYGLQYSYVYARFMYMKDNKFHTHEDYAIIKPRKIKEEVYCYECREKETTIYTYKLYIECKCGLRLLIPRRQLIWVRICH